MIYGTGQNLDGNFRILEVHEGGMAFVYIVEDMETRKRAAAKTMRDELISDPMMVARFRREMRIWVGMGAHPNIVRAYFVKDIAGAPFLFMEYLDGGSLFDVIKRTGSMPVDQVLRTANAIAEGMRHVHNRITPDGLRGILHRDLKPANILVSENGEIKVADFGLAGARNATLLTQTCDVVGTIHYSSPEQILDSHNVDKRSDIYAFGAIMYHTACGELPFQGDTWPDLVGKIKEYVPPAPIELRRDIPEQLSRIIMKCLEKSKNDRFDSFDEIIERLSQLRAIGTAETAAGRQTAANDLQGILDAAQREAAKAGSAFVEPVHLLLGSVLNCSEPLKSWLAGKKLKPESIAEEIRSSSQQTPEDGVTEEVKFKRSSRRAVGLAHSFAEQEGMTNPDSRQMLKALLREPIVCDILTGALTASGAGSEETEDLIDELQGLFELLDDTGS